MCGFCWIGVDWCRVCVCLVHQSIGVIHDRPSRPQQIKEALEEAGATPEEADEIIAEEKEFEEIMEEQQEVRVDVGVLMWVCKVGAMCGM